MKKSLFYLFALICSVSLFTSCKDDAEAWEELPRGEVASDKVEIQLNGVPTDGTVSFTAINSNTAQLELKNVIDGYSDVQIDVAMQEEADGSFIFSGKKEIATKPVLTRAASTPAPFLVVELNGTIAKDGTTTLDLKTSGLGLSLGSYSGENLVLTYNGNVLLDKSVSLDATAGDNADFLLSGVLPGEVESVLTNITYTDDTFEGTAATEYYNVKVEGKLQNKILTLSLTAELNEVAQNGYAGTWKLLNRVVTKEGESGAEPVNGPLYLVWDANPQIPTIVTLFGSMMVYPMLDNIALHADGNITARYWKNPELSMGGAEQDGTLLPPTHDDWADSPKNLAYWYVKGDCFYVVPNIAAIMEQISKDNGTDADANLDLAAIMEQLKEFNIDITKLIPTIMEWMKTGIPLKHIMTDEGLRFYVDKDMVAPIMEVLIPALPKVDEMVNDIIVNDPSNGFMIQMLMGMLGIEKISDLGTLWQENTTVFELSVNFMK